MKTFVATYMGSAAAIDAWKKMDENQRKQREAAGIDALGEVGDDKSEFHR